MKRKNKQTRPTLSEQLNQYREHEEIKKLSEEELINLLVPKKAFTWGYIDFCTFLYLKPVWQVIWWCVNYIRPWDIDDRRRYWRWEMEEVK